MTDPPSFTLFSASAAVLFWVTLYALVRTAWGWARSARDPAAHRWRPGTTWFMLSAVLWPLSAVYWRQSGDTFGTVVAIFGSVCAAVGLVNHVAGRYYRWKRDLRRVPVLSDGRPVAIARLSLGRRSGQVFVTFRLADPLGIVPAEAIRESVAALHVEEVKER